MLQLKIEPPQRPPFFNEIYKNRATVGRSPRCDVYLDDRFASRLHAELRSEGEACWITDFGSANGTYLNGQRLEGTARLRPGDRIQIGGTAITLCPQAEASDGANGETTLRPQTLLTPPSARDTGQPRITSVIEAMRQASGTDRPLGGLEQRGDLFAVLSKVGIALLDSSSLDEVLHQVTELIFEGIAADRAFFLLCEGDDGQLVCKAAGHRQDTRGDAEPQVRISGAIRRLVIERGQSVLTSNAQQDERFRNQESVVLSGVHSVMAVPLAVGGQVLGMIYVDSPLNAGVFTDSDLQLLTTIASVSAIRVDNALLLEQRIENERIKEQLQKAHNLQARLLPDQAPSLPGYQLSGVSLPCFEVGGDYFDFLPLADSRLLISVGDVSGKGMDAAILMSSVHAAVRVQADSGTPLAELARRVNRYLYQTTPGNRFVTAFLGQLDPASHRLTFTSAGHTPLLLIHHDGQVERFEASCPPLGVCPDLPYCESTLELGPGDVLVIYSDGVSEATNEHDEEFGEQRLADTVLAHPQLNALQLRDCIDEKLMEFCRHQTAADDLTLVILKRDA